MCTYVYSLYLYIQIYWIGAYVGGFIAFAVYATTVYIKQKNQEIDSSLGKESAKSAGTENILHSNTN